MPGPDEPRRICRRAWIAGCLAAGLAARARGQEPADPLAAVEAHAEDAGLGGFDASRTPRFLGVGDSPASFRKAALDLCEGLASAFLAHFRPKGFEVELPEDRLTVVTLAGPESYAAFLGAERSPAVGGHYDLDSNWLVMFDFRPDGGPGAAAAERANTLVLIHEANHLLCFNSGLLDRRGDVPLAISEGLAVYGEVWRPGRRSPIGAANRARTDAFALARRDGLGWIAVEQLLADDAPFDDEIRQQLAYAQSWIMVHTLLSIPALRRRFRSYLEAIRPRRDAGLRVEDAREHLGNLEDLDAELRRRAGWAR